MSFNFDAYYKKMNTGDIIVSYKGSITTEMINNMLEIVESRIGEGTEDARLRKKVYNVLVESLQNLYHHADELPEAIRGEFEGHFGVVVVAREGSGIRITTGNFIKSDKIKKLKDKIDKINSMNPDELKDMYKFILNHQKFSDKGGGGLGLIDIARKTGSRLQPSFQNFNNEYYFFSLEIKVTN
ncbi:MAG: hypothetical protein GX419_07065 [Bacteroidales bacterium]|nr:hypothetical protein [Bacteroidales bacterium]